MAARESRGTVCRPGGDSCHSLAFARCSRCRVVPVAMLAWLALWLVFQAEHVKHSTITTALFCLSLGTSARAEPYQVVSKEWAPYNYQENGQLTGMATDIVRAIMALNGDDFEMLVLPSMRASHALQTRPRTIMFSMFRTAEREALYKWVVPSVEESIHHRCASPLAVTVTTSLLPPGPPPWSNCAARANWCVFERATSGLPNRGVQLPRAHVAHGAHPFRKRWARPNCDSASWCSVWLIAVVRPACWLVRSVKPAISVIC